jgi:5-methylcytosine-specific restriction protein A
MDSRPYQHLYGRRWRKRRSIFLQSNPLCVMCGDRGLTVPATVADHIIPHKGDPDLFMGDLQALCQTCHESDKKRQERGSKRTIGLDGWAI